MKKIFSILFLLLFVWVKSQADDFHLMSEIDRDNFYFSIEDSNKIKAKLDTIIPDFNRLKEEGYYRTIQIKAFYYEEEKESIKDAISISNLIVEYFVMNGINAENIEVDFFPTYKNPYSKEPLRALIFYEGWNGKIKEGYEPTMPCDVDEKEILTQTQLKDWKERCKK
jgi:hypothetical protein